MTPSRWFKKHGFRRADDGVWVRGRLTIRRAQDVGWIADVWPFRAAQVVGYGENTRFEVIHLGGFGAIGFATPSAALGVAISRSLVGVDAGLRRSALREIRRVPWSDQIFVKSGG